MKRHESKPHRREVLKGVAAAGLASGLGTLPTVKAAEKDPPTLAAYTDSLSYQAGDQVRLHVSTTAKKFSVEIARVGARTELVWAQEKLPGTRQPLPTDASANGCRWPAAVAIPVPAAWQSGYYRVLLRATEPDLLGEAFFVVRSAHPGRDASILLQLTTNTYNAYNLWAGTSLYGGSKGQGRQVSFQRPYAGFQPGDQFTAKYSGWRNWEEPFVVWAENQKYKLDFAVNSDLEFHPEILDKYKLVLSVGHDEYWSAPMRDHLEAFIGRGGNVAFFSGNTAFWQVRSVEAGKALVSWKQDFHLDPVFKTDDHRFLSGMWSHSLVKRPENQMTGVSFSWGGYHRFFEQAGDGCYTVHRPDHWLFAGTGLKRGDQLGAKDKIVGYECDGCQFAMKDGLPTPTHEDSTPESFEILGTAPAGLSEKFDRSRVWVSEALYGRGTNKRVPAVGAAVLGCYTRGGTVVTTGCTEWFRGLKGKDPIVERISRNILDRLS